MSNVDEPEEKMMMKIGIFLSLLQTIIPIFLLLAEDYVFRELFAFFHIKRPSTYIKFHQQFALDQTRLKINE